ncbi:MAG: rhomboid family intramembrane serine protease [Opitutaceae bacterium]
MLSDRSYVRDGYPREKTSVLTWLICAIVAGFALQIGCYFLWPDGEASLRNELGLSAEALRAGHVWVLFTSSFLHAPNFLFHLGANLLALYFIGRELLPVLGSKRFVGLYTGAILTGALTWLAVHYRTGGSYIGATAGIEALLVVYACFYPHRRVDFLLFFAFPISVKPKHLAIGLLFFELFGLMYFELQQVQLPMGVAIASSAHLGGMFAGWFYFRYFHDVSWYPSTARAETELPRALKRSRKNAPVIPVPTIDMTNPSDVRAEVDRILDKINSHGFSALTADEKRLLDEAKDLLSRH